MPLFTDPPATYPDGWYPAGSYPAGWREIIDGHFCVECGEDIDFDNDYGLCPYCQLQLDAEREELAHPKRTRR